MSIMQSLPIYVAALSRDLKTRVTFGGNDAYCEKLHNEWLVNIPVFDVNNEETCAAAYAYALHESGHVKFTDFDAADHAEKQLPFNQALVRHLSNVFEDTYIERSLSKELKGAFARLSRMRVWLTSQSNFDENEIANKETKDLIVQFMYYQAFSEVGYDAYKSRLVIVENEFRDRTGDAFVDGLKAILVRCRTLSSSLQCVELTNDVLVYLKDEIDNQQQQQQQQKGGSQQQPQQGGEQNQQNGDDANDDQSGNGQSQSGDDANDDQSGNSQNQSGDDANDDQSGNGQSQSGDDANDD
ncbi:hypothetical protein, partial [Photobacterium leiognathi]|uniref:hypothetical protein n=1 Tax=Photobacterium leiognathi TaxID=553611 RepID=UPI00387EC948